MPSTPPSLGTCNFYFDAQNGLYMPSPPDLEKWTDQSGYLYGTGLTNAFHRTWLDVENRTSSTVALNTGTAAKYVWFGGDSNTGTMHAWASGTDDACNLPFPGTTGPPGSLRHTFHDFYMIVNVEGTNQHSNNCYIQLSGPYGAPPASGVTPTYAIHVLSNGQSPSGLSMRAMVGGQSAEWHLPVSHIGVDKWKLFHIAFSRTSIKIDLGTVNKKTQAISLATMPAGKYGRIGANYNPYWGSGDPRGIMFMMAYGSITANHNASQVSDGINYVTGMYSGGSGGGSQLVA